jgi:hypothetical protein
MISKDFNKELELKIIIIVYILSRNYYYNTSLEYNKALFRDIFLNLIRMNNDGMDALLYITEIENIYFR